MLGANINTVSWPNCGEIDIVEHKGSDVNKIYGTLHYPGNFGGNAVGGTKVITGANFTLMGHSTSLLPTIVRYHSIKTFSCC
jgi:beta-glucanase (GH16 family)